MNLSEHWLERLPMAPPDLIDRIQLPPEIAAELANIRDPEGRERFRIGYLNANGAELAVQQGLIPRDELARLRLASTNPKHREWYLRLERAEVQAARREEEESQELADLLATAKRRGVPETEDVLNFLRLPNPARTDGLGFVRRLLLTRRQHPKRPAIVFIIGAVRRGKTCAGAWLVAHAPQAQFVSFADMMKTTRYAEGRTKLETWETTAILVIDELDRVLGKKFNPAESPLKGDPRLRNLLLSRYNRGLVTVCMGNIASQVVDDDRGDVVDEAIRKRMQRQHKLGIPPVLVLTEPNLDDQPPKLPPRQVSSPAGLPPDAENRRWLSPDVWLDPEGLRWAKAP